MTRVTLTPLARQDLLETWLYIAENDVNAADRLYLRIEKRLEEIAEYPNLGVARPDIAPEARVLVVGRYLILYRLRARDINVVRVVDGARDLNALWIKDSQD